MKYNIGDRIQVVNKCSGLGKYGIVTSVDDENFCNVKYDDGKEDFHEPKCIKLVNPKAKEEDMQKFKIGDKVRVIDNGLKPFHYLKIGETGSVTNVNYDGSNPDYRGTINIDNNQWVNPEELQLISSAQEEERKTEIVFGPIQVTFGGDTLTPKKKLMTKLKTIAKKLLDSDIKVLVEAGYLDTELEVTEEGKEALIGMLFLANKEELAKEAQKKIKEEKK